jgi:hypothetical protein
VPSLWNVSIRTIARVSVVGLDTMLQAGRSRVRFPMRSLDFSVDLRRDPSSRTMELPSTLPITEISTRLLPGVKGLPARKTDLLIAICAPII